MDNSPADPESLSRRAAIKRALRSGVYAAPSILSFSLPAAVVAATSPLPTTVAIAVATATSPLMSTADLSLTISADTRTPLRGGAITLTITLVNNGPNAATNVVVGAQFDRLASFDNAIPSQGAYDSATGQWIVGTLPDGARATLTIRLTLVIFFIEPITFAANVAHSDQLDPNPSNDSASVTITPVQPPTADLAITATVSDQTPQFGEALVFTTTLTNNGPSTATNVKAFAPIPFGLTNGSVTPSQGMYDTNTGSWTVSALANGAHATLITRGIVRAFPMPIYYLAGVDSSDQEDPDPGNNLATISVVPQGLDLSIRKTVDTPNTNRGATVTFTVTLQNRGTIAGTGVMVTDTVPTQLTFVSAAPSQGVYNSATGLWMVGTVVANGTNPTLTIKLTAPNTGPLFVLNRADITHSDQVNAGSTTSDFATVSVR